MRSLKCFVFVCICMVAISFSGKVFAETEIEASSLSKKEMNDLGLPDHFKTSVNGYKHARYWKKKVPSDRVSSKHGMFYVIWQAAECDTRENLGIMRIFDGKSEVVWFESKISGGISFFGVTCEKNVAFLTFETFLWAKQFTYVSLSIKTGKFKLIYAKKD